MVGYSAEDFFPLAGTGATGAGTYSLTDSSGVENNA